MDRRKFCRTALAASVAASYPILSACSRKEPPVAVTANTSLRGISLDGAEIELERAAIKELGESMTGPVMLSGHPDYDGARSIWNGMHDKRPAMIARCMSNDDVANAVSFARERNLLVAVRGGGHSWPGKSICDDGLMIDLSQLTNVTIDTDKNCAHVGGGALLGHLDQASLPHGLVTTAGVVSHTGVGGFTLGGGFGRLNRKYGLAIDNLLSAEIVTTNGEVLTASADENPDLFWAIRGGGGNFGVVTRFEFQLHPVAELYAGLILYPRSAAPDLMRAYARMTEEAPDALSAMAAFLCSPEGDPVVGVFAVYHGPADKGAGAVARLRAVGSPLLDDIGPKPYTVVQQAFDEGFPSGNRNYWKSGYVSKITDAYIDVLVEQANKAVSPMCIVGVEHLMGGAVSRVARDDNAFGTREAEYNLLILGVTNDPGEDDAVRIKEESHSAATHSAEDGNHFPRHL